MRRHRAPLRVAILLDADDGGSWADTAAGVELELVRIEAEENASEFERLARGLEQTGSELAVRLRHGERMLPGGLDRLVAVLAAEPGAVAVYPAFALLDAVGTVTETVVPEELDLTEILRLQHAPAGPGAMFRREPALIAARFAAPERNGRLAFWLKLAAAGKLRRVAAALASAPARPSPPPGGIEAARARLEALQRAVAELPLPADSEQLVAAAARSACVLAAAEIEGFNDAADRICTVDRLELLAPPADPDADAELAILEAEVVDLERDLARRQTAVSVLESAVEGRRGG